MISSGTLESVLRQATLSKIGETLWPILSLDQQILILLTLLNGMAFYNEVCTDSNILIPVLTMLS
jgi:hypothetical protein